jgi:hypothetical protein
MLNCNQVTRLVSESQERPLTLSENLSLKLHLMMCAACRNFNRHIPFLHEAMQAYAKGHDEKSE